MTSGTFQAGFGALGNADSFLLGDASEDGKDGVLEHAKGIKILLGIGTKANAP